MSSNRVIVFTSANEDNIHTLIGILKSYKIPSEMNQLNNSFQITVSAKTKARAEAIIARHVKKPRQKKDPHSLFMEFARQNKVTAVLLTVSLICFCLSSFGQDLNRLSGLFISDVTYQRSVVDNTLVEKAVFSQGVNELQRGQFWRLFTNTFIHKNLIHFLINLLLIYQLGKIIEKTSGLSYLLTLCLLSVPINSYVEYIATKTPVFGGMNALVLTLYGFVLLRSLYDTRYFAKVQQGSIFFMALWLASGFVSIFPINMSYGALSGLILGSLWGFLSSRFLPEDRLIPTKSGLL